MPSGLRDTELARKLADPGPDDDARIHALALAVPRGGAVSRRTAAALHGFHVFGHEEQGLRLPLECTVPRDADPVRRRGVSSYSAILTGDVTEIRGIPVTSVSRTVLDVARWCAPDAAIAMLDRSLAMGLWDPEEVLEHAEQFRGDRGIRWARHLVAAADPGAESPGESACRLRLVDAGFPRCQTQIRVPRAAGRPFRIDMGWAEFGAAVEYDGREPHSSTEATVRDRWRREWLGTRDWTIVPARSRDVYGTDMALEYAVAQLIGVPPRHHRRRW